MARESSQTKLILVVRRATILSTNATAAAVYGTIAATYNSGCLFDGMVIQVQLQVD
jgi:hypothetical protein